MPKHPDMTWPAWVDPLGNEYGAGDMVAIAIINDRSPQMVFAQVVDIRKRDGKGELITTWHWEGGVIDTPGHRFFGEWSEYCTRVEDPYCKVRAIPLADSREFYRTKGERTVTYSIPENIIKLPITRDQFVSDAERKEAEALAAVVALREELA